MSKTSLCFLVDVAKFLCYTLFVFGERSNTHGKEAGLGGCTVGSYLLDRTDRR